MSASVQQEPAAAAEASTLQPVATPIEPVAPVTEVKSLEEAIVEQPKAEETATKLDGETTTAAPVEEKKEEKPEEPIYSGALGYKAPGLKK
jgi:hypothetical protein